MSPYKSRYDPREFINTDPVKYIRAIRNWGITFVTAIFGIRIFVNELQYFVNTQWDISTYLFAVLFLITGSLIFLWIWATQTEFDIFTTWLDPQHWIPPTTIKETAYIFFFACVLIALLFSSKSPFIYSIIFFVYSLGVVIGTKHLNVQIKEAIENSLNRLDEVMHNPDADQKLINVYNKSLLIIKDYFLHRNQFKRHIYILVFSVIALLNGVLWTAYQLNLFKIICYSCLIITILVSEIILAKWRILRDNQLRPLRTEQSDLIRKHKES